MKSWLLAGALTLMPRVGSAQPPPPAPRLSIGGGVGIALPFHSDFDFTPWVWETDVRIAVSSHLLIDVAVGEWRHAETTRARDIGVSMPPGTIGRLEQTTSRVQRMVQANLLITTAPARVRLAAGGGLGLLQHLRRTRQVTDMCSPGVSCGSYESSVSNGSASAQGVGGAEVHASDRIVIYGQARVVVPISDAGGGDLRLTTGLRWAIGR